VRAVCAERGRRRPVCRGAGTPFAAKSFRMIWCYFNNQGVAASPAGFALRALKRQILKIIGTTIPT